VNYTIETAFEQLDLFAQPAVEPVRETHYLRIPSTLDTFTNTETELHTSYSGRDIVLLKGELDILPEDRVCPKCGEKLHVNDGAEQTLHHLPVGASLMVVSFRRRQMFCPQCGHTHMQAVPFKAEHHRITSVKPRSKI